LKDVRITIRVTEDDKIGLDTLAEEANTTISHIIRLAIVEYLNKYYY
jgi:predicted transcriptional regulator